MNAIKSCNQASHGQITTIMETFASEFLGMCEPLKQAICREKLCGVCGLLMC